MKKMIVLTSLWSFLFIFSFSMFGCSEDDDDLSFIFHLFHHFQLFIVNCTPTTQCLTQLRIFPVDKGWNTDIFRVFPVTAITGKYNHITGVTVRNSSLQGNRVYNAPIKHRNTIHISDRTNKRQATGCPDNINHTAFIPKSEAKRS